ncbi:MAG: DUF2147 domain-containing protein [Saprospiraceae bacterium]
MKKLLMLLAVVAVVSIAAVPVDTTDVVEENIVELSDEMASVVGIWKTIDDETGKAKSHVKIYLAKNGKYYGKIVKLLNRDKGDEDPVCDVCPGSDKGKKIMGMKIVKGMEKQSDGTFSEGTIMDPKSGKVYTCKMWAEGSSKLMVRGYKGPFYRTQTWHKVN